MLLRLPRVARSTTAVSRRCLSTHELASDIKFTSSTDVVVVGSGAAGATAALSATWAGAEVVMLEKDKKAFGGTTNKSGGIFWIPNNPLMQEKGIKDDKDDLLNYMAKLSFPDAYDPTKPQLGLQDLDYAWLSTFYDTGSVMASELRDRGVFPDMCFFKHRDGELMYDYTFHEDHMPENTCPQGRGLGVGMTPSMVDKYAKIRKFLSKSFIKNYFPKDFQLLETFGIDLSYGVGIGMVNGFKKAIKKEKIDVKMDAGVAGVVTNEGGDVVGVKTSSGEYIQAKRGVVFCTGGFGNNPDMLKEHIRGPVYGTCAASGMTGDWHAIASGLGARMVNMDKVWGAQGFLEEMLETHETAACVFMTRGDGVIMVDRKGERRVNEKRSYDTRMRVHWEKDDAGEFADRFMFLVADQRTVDTYGADFAKTLPANPKSKFYIKGNDAEDLASNIRQRLSQLEGKTGSSFELDGDFSSKLQSSIDRFNGFARAGVDEDFHRGEMPTERQWHYTAPGHAHPNPTMAPLEGPLYAIILAPSVLDTKGGPATTTDAQVMREDGSAVGGLFGAGNAIASLSGDAYHTGGVTLGVAMTTGWIAGQSAAKSQVSL